MKIVVLALLVSSVGFASERSKRWNGFTNPNKIETSKKSELNDSKHNKKIKKAHFNSKVKFKSVSL